MLRKHPMWDPSSDKRDPNKFRKLQQYPNHSMLIAAVDMGYNDIVTFLLDEVNVDINYQIKGGETALHRACYRNRIEILVELLVHGADMELQEFSPRTTNVVLTPLFRAVISDRTECVDILLQNGCVNHYDNMLTDEKPKWPFTKALYDSLNSQTRGVIVKHTKLRKIRLFMKMNYVVKKHEK